MRLSDSDGNKPDYIYKLLPFLGTLIKDKSEFKKLVNYIISLSPTIEDKETLLIISDTENRHIKVLKEVFCFFSKGSMCNNCCNFSFESPENYLDGIQLAKKLNLAVLNRTREIYILATETYVDNVFVEILLEELTNTLLLHSLSIETIPLNVSLSSNSYRAFKNSSFSPIEANAIATLLGIDFSKGKFDLEEFTMGVNTELEHGIRSPETNVTNNDPLLTGKIALAHLNEFPDYYKRLSKLEEEAKKYWDSIPKE